MPYSSCAASCKSPIGPHPKKTNKQCIACGTYYEKTVIGSCSVCGIKNTEKQTGVKSRIDISKIFD